MNPQAATLRLAVFPRSNLLVDILLMFGGAAFVALAAQVKIDLKFTPVPITGSTFAVLLVGASFGAILGLASVGLYLFVGALGAPVYAGWESGWDILSGPTGGYIVGFVFAAGLTGWLAQREWDRHFNSAIAAMLTGSVVIYMFGLTFLAADQGLDFTTTLKEGLAPFVIGDLVKLYLAAMLLPGAWKLVKHLRGSDS